MESSATKRGYTRTIVRVAEITLLYGLPLLLLIVMGIAHRGEVGGVVAFGLDLGLVGRFWATLGFYSVVVITFVIFVGGALVLAALADVAIARYRSRGWLKERTLTRQRVAHLLMFGLNGGLVSASFITAVDLWEEWTLLLLVLYLGVLGYVIYGTLRRPGHEV